MVKKRYYNPEWEKPVHINEDTWAQLVTVAKVCLMHNEEADLFDMFNTYREYFLGGWEFTNAYKTKVDSAIEKEFAYYETLLTKPQPWKRNHVGRVVK